MNCGVFWFSWNAKHQMPSVAHEEILIEDSKINFYSNTVLKRIVCWKVKADTQRRNPAKKYTQWIQYESGSTSLR